MLSIEADTSYLDNDAQKSESTSVEFKGFKRRAEIRPALECSRARLPGTRLGRCSRVPGRNARDTTLLASLTSRDSFAKSTTKTKYQAIQ
jgi:hypothetical protein